MLTILILHHGMDIEWVIQSFFLFVSYIEYIKFHENNLYIYINLVLSLTGFLLIEQLLITDGTVVPLNRLRIIYAFGAAIALIVFGIGAAVVASRWYDSYPYQSYHHSKYSIFYFFKY